MRPSWSRDGRYIYFASNCKDGWQIWKALAEGGTATEVTRNGGQGGFESVDGRFLYYYKLDAAGIWRALVTGGEETQVIAQGGFGNNTWALGPDGVYRVNFETSPPTVEFFKLRDQASIERCETFERAPGRNVPRIRSVSRRQVDSVSAARFYRERYYVGRELPMTCNSRDLTGCGIASLSGNATWTKPLCGSKVLARLF